MSQKFWDWHAIISYDLKTKASPYQERMNDILKNLKLSNEDRVLDAGCGTGYLIGIIKKKYSEVQIEAVDFSRSMLNRAAKRSKGLKGVNFRKVDLNKSLPFDSNTFDAIVCDNVLYAVPRPQFTLKEFFRVLKPGRRAVIVIPKIKIDGKAIISSQFRGLKTFWQKLIAGLKLVIIYILILPFEISIDKKIKQGIYHALTDDQVSKMMEKIGFVEEETKLTFAGQNWLISARKH